MPEEINNDNVSSSDFDVNGLDFLLFLILILLFLGNQNTFNSYFQLFDTEVSKLNNVLGAFQDTANGLKSVFATSYNFE
ncbi:MAG: hypothetical protein ACOCRL_00555 [Bacillota bacterium]